MVMLHRELILSFNGIDKFIHVFVDSKKYKSSYNPSIKQNVISRGLKLLTARNQSNLQIN